MILIETYLEYLSINYKKILTSEYMKTIVAKVLLILVLAMNAGTPIKAQLDIEKKQSQSVNNEDISSAKLLSVSIVNEIQRLKIQISENETRFKTLMALENPDMEAVYQNIDESQLLHKQLAKFRFQLIKIAIFS